MKKKEKERERMKKSRKSALKRRKLKKDTDE